MKKIKCEKLIDGNCAIASKIAGFDIEAKENNCRLCLLCKDAKKPNEFNRGLINFANLKKKDEQLVSPDNLIGRGVGTELKKLIPEVLNSSGCGCRAYALKMNRWGIEGCEQRFDEIIDYLVHKSNSKGLLSWVPDGATRIASSKFLKIAIQKAKAEIDKSKYKWFTAVTTSPRIDCTLQRSVDSMVACGFDPVIFAEPNSTILSNRLTIQNQKRLGVWHNWLNSCIYAIHNTDAEIIMTVQDDSLFHPDCKSFTELLLWPDEDCGFLSLYTPKHYTINRNTKENRPVGVNRIYTKSLWGACSLVWHRDVLKSVIESEIAQNWCGAKPRSGKQSVYEKRRRNPEIIANSDTAIGKIMNSLNKKMFFVDPSPVKHIAEHSTISHGGNRGRRNCHRCADWNISLMDQVPITFETKQLVQCN